jgi:hypothetical protein
MTRSVALIVLVAGATMVGDVALGERVIQDDHSPIPTCARQELPRDVEALIRPVLLARVAALEARREWDSTYEDAFYRLLKLRSPTAREAQTALMAYYTGEHYGEELLDLTTSKPEVFAPLVAKYKTCRPTVTFEDRLQGIVVLRTLYELFDDDMRGRYRAVEQGDEADER